MSETEKKVFLSSTRSDLYQYRKTARKVFAQLGLKCSAMEDEPQTGYREDPSEISINWARKSDWVVLILGWHFGTVSPNETRSITQQEFDYAETNIKRRFVYFSGEGNADDSYEWDPEKEEVNLLAWRRNDDEAMKLFRERVKEKHGRSFKNIDDFESKLRADLEHALQDEREDAQRTIDVLSNNGRVMKWIITSKPKFDQVIQQVETLCQLKSIHDTLHHLRQDVIRQMLEVVLPTWDPGREWPTEMMIYQRAESDRNGNIKDLKRWVNALNDPRVSPASDEIDISLLITVSEYQTFGMRGDVRHPDRDLLQDDVLEFSKDVQFAFTDVNSAMGNRAVEYFKKVKEIENDLDRSKKEFRLDERELESLRNQIDTAMGFAEHLDKVMKLHDDWQEFHDEFMRMESERETPKGLFSSIDYFVRKRRQKLELLVSRSKMALKEDPTGAIHIENSDPLDCGGMLSELGALPETTNAGSEDEFQRKRAEDFFRMRQAFDNVFFSYDTSVLDIVKHACAGAESALDQLFRLRPAALIE